MQRMSPTTGPPGPPFGQFDELPEARDGSCPNLPGHPRVKLADHEALYKFLQREIWAEELEAISHRLWWLSTVNSRNISPLHRQIVQRRNIVVTEEAKLHLTWFQDQIFIKPIPKYLMSHSFWVEYLPKLNSDDGGHPN
jgi:hypothetical protein